MVEFNPFYQKMQWNIATLATSGIQKVDLCPVVKLWSENLTEQSSTLLITVGTEDNPAHKKTCFCSSKQSETSRSNRSTPVKKATRLVSYIDPDEEEDPDKTIKDEEVEGGNQDMEFDKSDEQLGNYWGLIL